MNLQPVIGASFSDTTYFAGRSDDHGSRSEAWNEIMVDIGRPNTWKVPQQTQSILFPLNFFLPLRKISVQPGRILIVLRISLIAVSVESSALYWLVVVPAFSHFYRPIIANFLSRITPLSWLNFRSLIP